jgi:hypothetical protein
MAALMVEYLKVLMVEHPKGSLSVEPPPGPLPVLLLYLNRTGSHDNGSTPTGSTQRVH